MLNSPRRSTSKSPANAPFSYCIPLALLHTQVVQRLDHSQEFAPTTKAKEGHWSEPSDRNTAESLQGLYVMLSRVKSPEGVALYRDFPPQKLEQQLSQELRDEFKRLRNSIRRPLKCIVGCWLLRDDDAFDPDADNAVIF